MSRKNKLLLLLSALLNLYSPAVALGKATFRPQLIEAAKKSIVTIKTHATLKAYGPISTGTQGTGCVVDKQRGLILTNKHVVDPLAICSYNLTFHDGQQAEAKLCYYDPWLDYAFLKVAPEDIPEDATSITFSDKAPKEGQPVFIIGNNEGKSFSIHTGNVSSTHEVIGTMPQGSINISLNTRGGSSGSPIMDKQGKAVALNYASNSTFAIGLHPGYIRHALAALQRGDIPARRHIGAMVALYSLNDGIKHRKFPAQKAKQYTQKYPTSQSNALQVTYTLPHTPAHGQLLPGDIIWAVDGKEIGPHLAALDMAMNCTKATHTHLTICRDGQWMELNIALYPLEAHTVKRMVHFGGALFFEADDIVSDKTGLPAGTLTFSNAKASTTFANMKAYHNNGSMTLGLKVLAIDQVSITTLDQLIAHIPSLIKKKHFNIDYINLIPLRHSLSELFGERFSQYEACIADVTYDANSPEPKVFTFNRETMQWESKRIEVGH